MAGETFAYFLVEDPNTAALPLPVVSSDRLPIVRGDAPGEQTYFVAPTDLIAGTRASIGVGPVMAAKDFGAVGNGTTDDAAALTAGAAAALVAGQPLGLSGVYRVSSDLALTCDLQFAAGTSLFPDPGKTITITGRVDASDLSFIFIGDGTVVAATAPYVSVQWWGAGHGIADDAVAFRASLGSNRIVKVPAANYTFRSLEASPGHAFDDAGWLISGLSNIIVSGYGAVLQMDSAHRVSGVVMLNELTNMTFSGFTFFGDRSGLTTANHSTALAVLNLVHFTVRDLALTGNWGGKGSGLVGDWLADGLFENFSMPKVSTAVDVAFLKGVTLRNFFAVGADNDGNQGAGQIGNKGFSNIWDGPNSTGNLTGYTFTSTDGVRVENFDVSNMATGWYLSSGTNIAFIGNHWHDNPGLGGAKGLGGFLDYSNDGPYNPADPATRFTSVGHPFSYITIIGDIYSNNGTGTAGYGILINNASVDAGDTITDINVKGCLFENNTNIAVGSLASTKLANVSATGSIMSGANQTTGVNGFLAAVGGAGNILQNEPADPTGTTSTSEVMMGLAEAFTPHSTGTVLVTVSGNYRNTGSGDGVLARIRRGTGASPANGDAATGTSMGSTPAGVTAAVNQKLPFSIQAIATGLTPGTAYWFDLSLEAITGGTAAAQALSVTIIEIGS